MGALAQFQPEELPVAEAGSFRDPSGGVVLQGGRIFRFLSGSGADDVLTLLEQPWFRNLVSAGDVISSRPVTRTEAPAVYAMDADIAAVVEHPRVGFVSYPYEWPFEMLRGAALLQLELTSRAFANGYTVKDATPYNIQYVGGRPVFIDVPSFERYVAGEGWRAYSQFCRLFLNPLYLEAYGGIAFQTWLRSSLEGLDTDLIRRLLPLRAKLRPSVFIDVVLQSVLNHRFANDERALSSLATRTIPDNVVCGMLGRMTNTIDRIRVPKRDSAWVAYETTKSHYSGAADAFKEAFVRRTLQEARPHTVWDLGCNTGQFSVIAAEVAEQVVALDSDQASIDVLYRRARNRHPNILPLVMDLGNPSPDQGWAQVERRGFSQRGTADWALCLALIHHVSISGNVPFERFFDWLASSARAAIVEFVPKSDPMVQLLLTTRKDVYHKYTPLHFEAAMARHFLIVERAPVPDCERVLYAVKRK